MCVGLTLNAIQPIDYSHNRPKLLKNLKVNLEIECATVLQSAIAAFEGPKESVVRECVI